jgi:glycosyltransferase involved in cell wall biosynthesis
MPISIAVVGFENPRVRDLFREVERAARIWHMNIGPMPRVELPIDETGAEQIWKAMVGQFGKPDAVVFTWPHLAILAERFTETKRIYYCKDPFEHWACWKAGEIRELESRMLRNCDLVFAVSRALVEDFRPRARGKVVYLPNAVEESFLIARDLPRPGDLPRDKPVLGSVGQINETYDWEYIHDLAARLPHVRICLVGNITEGTPGCMREIVDRASNVPNIRFLGKKPHEEIRAYMHHFDICMNFLAPGDHADRRSPLRLYDYLTTDRPIISNAVREAREHKPFVEIAQSSAEAGGLVNRILAGEIVIDAAGRRQYISKQTWADRAKEILGELQLIV